MRSSISSLASRDDHDRLRVFALWTGVLAGPIVMLVLLEVNYVMSYVACETKQTWFLHLATAIAMVLVAAAGAWAWQAGRGPMEIADSMTAPMSPQTCQGRSRWMAYVAAASSVWFILVILAMSVPVVVLETCQ